QRKGDNTMNTKTEVNKYRTTAIVVGVVYLLGFVVGLVGMGLFTSILSGPGYLSTVSTKSTLLGFGAVLWLMAVIGDAAHGVLMFPVLKQHSERMAAGYLAFRIIDATFVAIMVLFVMIQIPLGSEYLKAAASDAPSLQALSTLFAQIQQYAYQIGMSALGVSGLMLCYTLYKAKLVPGWLAIWGLVGYATIFIGMLSAIMGSGLGDLSSIPGGLWEVFMGVWLIAKGFNSSAFVSLSAKTSTPAESLVPQTNPANS
ncbi:MAG TPA: DUF4386 domain-containing protein, partial [Anaerolineales bacterium]|nr:DUF4386 domain-containing protein [Anaerolineales bacterium]